MILFLGNFIIDLVAQETLLTNQNSKETSCIILLKTNLQRVSAGVSIRVCNYASIER